MKKRSVARILCAVITAALLAGCGSSQEGSPAEGKEQAEEPAKETEETSGESEETEETEEGTETPSMVVTKVKAIDVVNIRTSDSETADKLGKAAVGDEFTLLEERGNGWSKVEYDGGEAFIKSDFVNIS